MTKESPSSNYPKLVKRIVFRDEQSTIKNGGEVTDVDFSEGQGVFNGTSSKINYNLGLNGTYSVRFRCNPTNFAANMKMLDARSSNADGTGYFFLAITTGVIDFRNDSGELVDYEISGLTIRRIYDADSFAVFIKGGDFGNEYTLVDTTGGSGTNPVVDATYTTSEYLVLDLDAADTFGNLKITDGVKQ